MNEWLYSGCFCLHRSGARAPVRLQKLQLGAVKSALPDCSGLEGQDHTNAVIRDSKLA